MTAKKPPSPRRSSAANTSALLSGKLVQIGNLLVRSASRIYRSRFGLREEEWRIVALLGADESLPLTELARRAGLQKSQLSRGAATLLEKGLLSRIANRDDARKACLRLTRGGRTIHAAIVASAARRSAYLAEGIDSVDVKRLLGVLDRIIRRAGELDAAPAPAQTPLPVRIR